MSSGATGDDYTLTTADHRILQYLAGGPEYPALIASHTGLHIPLVDRRCKRLEATGFIEPVSNEVIYRLTDRGRGVVDSP